MMTPEALRDHYHSLTWIYRTFQRGEFIADAFSEHDLNGWEMSARGNMTNRLRFLIAVLISATACLAQDGLIVQSKGKRKWPSAEAQKIYLSACSVVQREFGSNRPVAPRVTLVLGASKNEVWFQGEEIRLTKWDRYAFAQGVVRLAFVNLMPSQQRLAIAKRAVNWVDATVDIEQLRK